MSDWNSESNILRLYVNDHSSHFSFPSFFKQQKITKTKDAHRFVVNNRFNLVLLNSGISNLKKHIKHEQTSTGIEVRQTIR